MIEWRPTSFSKFLALFSAVTIAAFAQERFQTGELQGFTKSPTEHVINRSEKPIIARRAVGVVVSKTDSQPLSNAVFEVRGPVPGVESRERRPRNRDVFG